MEINSAGFSPKELVPNRANIEQEQTQRTAEKDENIQAVQKPLEPRPVDQAGSDKLTRIDIYA